MSDESIARIARDLAQALMRYAHDRSDAEKKNVAQLHTDLCAAYRRELSEPQQENEP